LLQALAPDKTEDQIRGLLRLPGDRGDIAQSNLQDAVQSLTTRREGKADRKARWSVIQGRDTVSLGKLPVSLQAALMVLARKQTAVRPAAEYRVDKQFGNVLVDHRLVSNAPYAAWTIQQLNNTESVLKRLCIRVTGEYQQQRITPIFDLYNFLIVLFCNSVFPTVYVPVTYHYQIQSCISWAPWFKKKPKYVSMPKWISTTVVDDPRAKIFYHVTKDDPSQRVFVDLKVHSGKETNRDTGLANITLATITTASLRYRYLSWGQTSVPSSNLLNFDGAYYSTDKKALVVVEGVFDTFRFDVYARHLGVRAVGLNGRRISDDQITKLDELMRSGYRRLFVMLDADAIPQMVQIVGSLAHLNARVMPIEPPYGDPGEMPSDVIVDFCNRMTKGL